MPLATLFAHNLVFLILILPLKLLPIYYLDYFNSLTYGSLKVIDIKRMEHVILYVAKRHKSGLILKQGEFFLH